MKAIISDIHGNLEALKAVLEDIASRKISEIICLGDIVGYGPNPVECIDLVIKHCTLTIKGNHEEAALGDPVDFNYRAETAIRWTQERIRQSPPEVAKRDIEFLKGLADTASLEGSILVHGSPRQPTRDYLFPRDVRDRQKMAEIFAKVPKYCFAGHSHIPGVFTETGEYTHPADMTMAGIHILDDVRCVINVGSVGQPRDEDARACYCTFDGDSVVFRRVRYDITTTKRKIYAVQRLHKSLGDRLEEGR